MLNFVKYWYSNNKDLWEFKMIFSLLAGYKIRTTDTHDIPVLVYLVTVLHGWYRHRLHPKKCE